ncbi:Lactose permease [Fusarium oxysporum f. sp. albedinis]|nr:Lactose permease [Fusarium oxysporum f. sp. albedinis]
MTDNLIHNYLTHGTRLRVCYVRPQSLARRLSKASLIEQAQRSDILLARAGSSTIHENWNRLEIDHELERLLGPEERYDNEID